MANVTIDNEEKKAFLKVAVDMASADGEMHVEESNILKSLIKGFHFTDEEFQDAMKMNIDESADMITRMSGDQKDALVTILVSIMQADGEIHEDELKMLGGVAARCEIELSFD